MRISLPPIASRYFPLYWGLINFTVIIFIAIVNGFSNLFNFISVIPDIGTTYGRMISYFFALLALNGVPLIVLNSRLKWKQKIAWITSESISHIVFIYAILNVVTEYIIASEDYPKIKDLYNPSFKTLYDAGAYQPLAIAIFVWTIVPIFQVYIIKFKYPKCWLSYAFLNPIVTYSLFCLLLLIPTQEKSALNPGVKIFVDIISPLVAVFVCALFAHSFTGLGLYLSGMGISKQRDDRDRSLE